VSDAAVKSEHLTHCAQMCRYTTVTCQVHVHGYHSRVSRP